MSIDHFSPIKLSTAREGLRPFQGLGVRWWKHEDPGGRSPSPHSPPGWSASGLPKLPSRLKQGFPEPAPRRTTRAALSYLATGCSSA